MKDRPDNEFLSIPTGEEDQNSRRDFLKLMGASIALTSMSCIRRPAEKIVPYANRPEEIEPGIANYYASTYTQGNEAQTILVKTREGRPIYVKSNAKTGISSRALAHVLDLYDPDRLKHPVKKVELGFEKSNWDEFDLNIKEALKLGNVSLLTGNVYSPTLNSLIDNFKQKGVDHYSWEPISFDGVKKANQLCFRKPVVPGYNFENAKVVVSIGADFLGTYLSPVEFSNAFSKTRNPDNMSKLISFESMQSLTGANADVRVMVKPSDYLNVVKGLCHEMIKRGAQVSDSVKSKLEKYADIPSKINSIDPEVYSKVCDNLWQNKNSSLVISASSVGSDDTELQIFTNLLNYILGSYQKTIDMDRAFNFSSSYGDLDNLFKKLNTNKVSTLIVAGVNPAYSSGSFSKYVSKARRVFYLGDRLDETAQHASFVAPLSHSMEAWGDAEIKKDIYSIVQPTIRPLYDTRSIGECLLKWTDNPAKYYDYLKAKWAEYSASFGKSWIEFLHKGFFVKSLAKSRVNFNYSAISSIIKTSSLPSADIELFLYQKSPILEGNQTNNAWLQELPCPVTKVVWDNYLVISKPLADRLKFSKSGQHALVTKGNTKLSVPVLISYGVLDNVVGLAVGYGRTNAGNVGTGVGVNAYGLISNGVVGVKKTSGFTNLANVQGHHRLHGRQLTVDATLDEYKKSPSANIKSHKIFSLYPKHEYKGHRWAMAIDLNLCTGCSACVTACQSENNIPSVGKKYVLRGREMHWIRIDRYYKGDNSNPEVLFQPMLCQHCENASCEAVCPVVATVHGEEGLNQMIYNRCVGTRYCSNNCPYKVRRFNWFGYSKVKKPLNKAFNPDVTVRTRGVMEKCTFCTQRIKETKILAKRKNKTIGGDDVVTACQEACPTNAIIFGDINNPTSKIKKAFQDARSFSVLEEYNNVPMVKYKTKIRNKGNRA